MAGGAAATGGGRVVRGYCLAMSDTSDPTAQPLRIANASGYWGDDLTALRRQLEGGPVDVVTMDFLAEITMSILQKQVQRNPDAGYAVDFVDQLDDVMALAMEQGVTIIANAGGVRPLACGEAILARAKEQHLDPRVGVVAGDDLIQKHHPSGTTMASTCRTWTTAARSARSPTGCRAPTPTSGRPRWSGPWPRGPSSSSPAGSPTPASPWPP